MEQMKNDVWVAGKHAKAVHDLFSDVQIWSRSVHVKGLVLMANVVLPNQYRNPLATVKTDPLYILVPNAPIDGVWPNGVGDETKFGTAERHEGHVELTKTIGIFNGKAGICICLKPLTDEEVSALEVGSLGL